MGRLSYQAPRIGTQKPRLGVSITNEVQPAERRDRTQAWRAWYKTARWQKLRWSILVRDLFTCAKCKAIKADTSQLVCDHIERHQGNEAAFWSGPFQTLCASCHSGAKQREEHSLLNGMRSPMRYGGAGQKSE